MSAGQSPRWPPYVLGGGSLPFDPRGVVFPHSGQRLYADVRRSTTFSPTDGRSATARSTPSAMRSRPEFRRPPDASGRSRPPRRRRRGYRCSSSPRRRDFGVEDRRHKDRMSEPPWRCSKSVSCLARRRVWRQGLSPQNRTPTSLDRRHSRLCGRIRPYSRPRCQSKERTGTPRCARCAPVTRKDSGRAETPVDFGGLRAAVTNTVGRARRAGSRREPAR
jgi:hypothetical protein